MYIKPQRFLLLGSVAWGVWGVRENPHLSALNTEGKRVDFSIPATTLQSQYHFYHSSADIAEAVQQLAKSCAVPISVQSHSCGDKAECSIDVVDIGDAKNSERVFLLFGEHARELISPETALATMRELCNPKASSLTKQALEVAQFRIIPNGNPESRRKVEFGEFCLRTNGNGVDLNRNWDYHWNPSAPPLSSEAEQLDPGKRAFSETETKIFRSAVEEFRPSVFAAVHSGTMGMYMPWAYSDEAGMKGIRNARKMKQVLNELDDKYCQCPSGGAAEQVGYDSPGTCLDWVHSRTDSQYSFAFEIYTGRGVDDLKKRYRDQRLRGESSSSFLEMSLEDQELSRAECFAQFNPETEDEYDQVVDNWSQALIELALMAHRK